MKIHLHKNLCNILSVKWADGKSKQATLPLPLQIFSMLGFFFSVQFTGKLFIIIFSWKIMKKDKIVIEMYLTWINTWMIFFSVIILINSQGTKILYGEYSDKKHAPSDNGRVILWNEQTGSSLCEKASTGSGWGCL